MRRGMLRGGFWGLRDVFGGWLVVFSSVACG